MPIFIPKDRKSLFRQLLAGMYDAVIITDPSGYIIEINPRAEEYFGHTQESVVDKPISLFIRGLSGDIVQRIRKGLEDDRHMMIDAFGIPSNGEKFACEVTASIIDLTNQGDIVFTIRNVERRRKVREMLRAKESAFRISHSALFACDRNGKFTYVNEAFLAMFNIEDEEAAREMTFFDLMTDDPLPENFKKALEGDSSEVCIVAETDNESDKEELEITLAPIKAGAKVRGVAGSINEV
jgi:PAS domain S-box-containing protein